MSSVRRDTIFGPVAALIYRYSSCSSSRCSSRWGDLFKAPSFQMGSGWNLAGLFFNLRHMIDGIGFLIWRHTFNRWRPWRYFTQKSAAIWWLHMQRLAGAYAAASANSADTQYICILFSYGQFSDLPGTTDAKVYIQCRRYSLREEIYESSSLITIPVLDSILLDLSTFGSPPTTVSG